MRFLQIAFAIATGIGYIVVRMAYPEMGFFATWGLRLAALLLIGGFFAVTNVLSGRDADASPLSEDKVPSLNLSSRPPDA